MITTAQTKNNVAQYLQSVTDFCVARGQSTGRMFVGNTRQQIFRYVAFCHLTGRLNTRVVNGVVTGVVICWPDFWERIEARQNQGKPQFEWTAVHRGDSVFVAEVIGGRASIRVLYQGMVEAFPNLLSMRIFTMRHGKLVQLSQGKIERFMR